jgi:hypothetical protein|tara:strand:+ start:3146 stop:3346 length:201 start_codon:yes stop_codon:yes gene_type:complete
MSKKVSKINILTTLMFLLCSILLNSCVNITDCRLSPDYERIAESMEENKSDLRQTELKSALFSCSF